LFVYILYFYKLFYISVFTCFWIAVYK